MLSHAMSTTDTKWASALDNAILGEIGMNNNLDKFILDNVTNAPVLSFLLSNLSDSGFQSFLSNELATQISDGGKLLDLMNAFIMGGSSLSGYQFELREGVTTSDWQNGLLAVLGSAYKMSFNQSGLTVIPGQYSKDEYSNIRDTINKGKENATDSEKKARSILLKFIDWKTSSKNSLKELLENMIIDNTPH